jgi:predicted dehydrogenase
MAALKAGIVGYGYMGQIRHRNVLDHPDLELSLICDPSEQSRLDAARLPSVGTFQELVDSEVDVIFVCTPNFLTPDVCIYAMERGRHVFCEKPPGRTLNDIERMISVEQRHPELRLIFGFNHRHHPGIIDAKSIIGSGSLGEVLTLRGLYGKSGGTNFERSWRNDPQVSGGGILLDQGIHMLDLFRFFCGEFEEVMAMRALTHWDIPVEDNAMLLLRSSTGQLATLHSSATSWKHQFRLEIGLERGYVVVSGLLSKTGSYGRETLVIGRLPLGGERVALGNPREETVYYDVDPSWDIEVDHFVDCIRNGKPISQGTSLDALRVMEIVDRAYQQPLMRRKGSGR